MCACAPLCPAVWSMLPVELLQHVFARLPLPEIIRLRVLSKTWDKYVTGATPGFTKLCAEQNPSLFALVSEGGIYDGDGPMVVQLYDSKGNKWHSFVHETFIGETRDTMLAGGGGLVCCVSTPPNKEMEIVVFNPLTRQGRELPLCSSLSRNQPRMVQLVMDRDSKCYKVLVVGPKKQGGGDAVAMIFSSLTGKWSTPNIFSDLIFGHPYSWKSYSPGFRRLEKEKASLCAYDCASSTLLELDDGYPGKFRDQSVLVQDRLFVLHMNHNKEYVLKEYQAQSSKPHWKVHKCYELDDIWISGYQGNVELEMQLYGCQDFLLVFALEGFEDDEAPPKRTLLFDLSTRAFQEISKEIANDPPGDMFELRWDAVA